MYVHRDKSGRIFYVGKGTGDRAYRRDSRHPVWHAYVQRRLNGEYDVQIIRDNLTEEEAESLEARLIEALGPQLVNWINPGRQFDYAAIEKYHAMRTENRRFVAETRPLEATDPHEAIRRYRLALQRMREYESMVLERGLVAELMSEIASRGGDLTILDRLTLCLWRTGQYEELIAEATQYFAEFPVDKERSLGKVILRRVERARKALGIRRT